MKSLIKYIPIILSIFSLPSFGQIYKCFCDKDSLMNSATVSCDTTLLANKSKLYWQFTCDSIWLTLENEAGRKKVINEVPINVYNYTYRLGYHLIKEYDKSILFRSGCLSNGPCIYTLIDKNTGSVIEKFDQLICIDTDVQNENPHTYNFEFIVYLSDNSDYLFIYYIDSKQLLNIPFKDKLTELNPQSQFKKMTLSGNLLTIYYELDQKTKKALVINLYDKKYRR